MDLDGGELAVKVDLSDAGFSDQSFEFCEHVVPRNCPEIGKKHF